MMRKIKYALVGFGGIAQSRIASEGFACDTTRFKSLDDAQLVGVTDLNPAGQQKATKLGLKWYDNIASILSDSAVEAVFVATNNMTHSTIASQVLESGRHVIVEKPIATTSDQAAALVALARTRQLSLAIDHMMTQNVYNQKAKQLVADGTLGIVNDSCFHMEFHFGSAPQEASTWRCAMPQELGGPIGDVASHCLYMAEFIFESPVVALACVYYPKLMETVVEDGAYLKFTLASGMTGSVRVAFCEPRGSMQATLDNLGYEIFGTQGVLRGHGTLFQLSGHPDEPVTVRLELDTFSERRDIQINSVVNIYQEVIRHHARSIIEGKPMDGSDGLHNLQLIQAAHESARQQGALIQIEK